MNSAPNDDQFDAEGKSRGPFARVQLIYAPDLERNSAAPHPAADIVARQPKPRQSVVRHPEHRAASARETSLDRHHRKCVVCSHPDREAIEELFLHWHSPASTARHYNVPVRSLFRHAHATGLYAARQGNLRAVLDRVLDRAEEATVGGDSIIRAVRAYTCLTPDNQWVEPPSRVVFSTAPLASPGNSILPNGAFPSLATSHSPVLSGVEGSLATESLATASLIDTPAIRK